MKQYTSTCDRCKKTATSENSGEDKLKLHEVGVGIYQPQSYSQYRFIGKAKEWCEACCIEVGILAPNSPNSEVPVPPTIEDVLRNMVREEIQDATGAAS